MSAEIKNKGTWQEIIKGGLIATLISVLLVLAFALIARLFGLSSGIVPVVNEVIKVISVAAAVFIAVKTPSAGYLKGLGIGVVFAILSCIIFWLLGGSFNFVNLLIDIAIACASGLVAGIIAVNRKK